jgi:cytochrome c-type biogenesis protein CcmH
VVTTADQAANQAQGPAPRATKLFAAPNSAGPPFFLGLAMIQSGRLGEGRAMWADLLARSPADAPWRADLEKRLGELDGFVASQAGAPDVGGAMPPPDAPSQSPAP